MTPAVSKQLAHELELIQKLGLAEYFLIVWDIMRFSKERGILAQGRGSAANSVVAYVLGITNVDPIALDLLFERFLSEERGGAGHRRRLRQQGPRAGHPVRLRALRPRPRRHGLRSDHLPPPLRHPRRWQGAGAVAGAGRSAGETVDHYSLDELEQELTDHGTTDHGPRTDGGEPGA